MKKLFFCFMAWITLGACSDKPDEVQPQFDPPHYCINFFIFEEETNRNLLHPDVHFIPKKGVVATCWGEEFPLERFDKPDYDPQKSFRWERYTEGGVWRYRVVFDGFTIDKSFREELTIFWGDVLDLTTHLVVSATVDNSGAEPVITRSLLVDGEPVACEEGADWTVTIWNEKEQFAVYPDRR